MNALTWPQNLTVEHCVLRPADHSDAPALAALMAEPEVDQWWHQAWEPARWETALADLIGDPDTLPLALTRDGALVGYIELYRVATDVLGGLIEHSPTDVGLHLALGHQARGRGLGARVLRAVRDAASGILHGCRRVVAEPDVLNTRSHRSFLAAGFDSSDTVVLPDKTALLMSGTPAMEETVHDVVAVGAGPFNLGLAALASTVHGLDTVVFDREPEFTWHRGLMIDGALLQVSFLADLVTLVDPTNPYSFLSYLRDQDRMYPFYVREQFHPTRAEYEDYLRWAAQRLPGVRFGHEVTSIEWDEDLEVFDLLVTSEHGTERHRARNIVLGVGTEPSLPAALREVDEARMLHSGSYLPRLDDIDAAPRVTVIGSGQSGAECFLHAIQRAVPGQQVSWLTRNGTFAPLDYSKLTLEMTTPDYVDHFHALPETRRDELVAAQWRHYKGISTETLDQIHDALYNRSYLEDAAAVQLRQGVAVTGATEEGTELVLNLLHTDTGRHLEHRTDLAIAATGYAPRPLPLHPDLDRSLHRDAQGRLQLHRNHSVAADGRLDGRIFVANADLHTHGPAAPDLGIGAVRNALIINSAAGRTCYPIPGRTSFTTFETTPEGALL